MLYIQSLSNLDEYNNDHAQHQTSILYRELEELNGDNSVHTTPLPSPVSEKITEYKQTSRPEEMLYIPKSKCLLCRTGKNNKISNHLFTKRFQQF